MTVAQTRHRRLTAKKSASRAKTTARNATPVKVILRQNRVNARYDAAEDDIDLRKHWLASDSLSADAAASPAVRKRLRERARYEINNNCYARGMVETLANTLVGTVPHLQILTKDTNLNRKVEDEFNSWAKRIKFGKKLRTMAKARIQDGEAIAVLFNNPSIPGRVKLDIGLIEADRLTNPLLYMPDDKNIDGIEFDSYGNPIRYTILKYHPGDCRGGVEMKYDTIDASQIIHWFRQDRPNQHRGVSELTPSLPLFAFLRRYVLAVLGAAETAADYAAVVYSKATDVDPTVDSTEFKPFDIVELEKRMATVLPEGWELGQIKAEQPTTTFAEFKGEILAEIARAQDVPFNVAAGTSKDFNYASGRLDHKNFFKSITVQRSDMDDIVLSRIIDAFMAELMLSTEFAALRRGTVKLQWIFDGDDHVDPQKEAKAQDTRLKNGSTNHKREYGRQGLDWEEEIEQSYKEIALKKKLAKKYGLTDQEAGLVKKENKNAA